MAFLFFKNESLKTPSQFTTHLFSILSPSLDRYDLPAMLNHVLTYTGKEKFVRLLPGLGSLSRDRQSHSLREVAEDVSVQPPIAAYELVCKGRVLPQCRQHNLCIQF